MFQPEPFQFADLPWASKLEHSLLDSELAALA